MIIATHEEKAKWPILIIVGLNLIFTLVDNPSNVFGIVPNILIIAIAFGYQHRLIFNKADGVVEYFHGIKLFNRGIFKLKNESMDFHFVDKVKLQTIFGRHCIEVLSKTPQSGASRFQVKLGTKKSKVVEKERHIKTELVKLGLNSAGGFNGVDEQVVPENGKMPLDENSVATFKQPLSAAFSKISSQKSSFKIAKWLLPLPVNFYHKQRAPLYFAVFIGVAIGVSTQQWSAVGVCIIVGIVVSLISHMILANQYYHVLAQTCYDIEITAKQIFIPALFFDNRQPRTLLLEQLDQIDVQWNWLHVGHSNGRSRAPKPYIFDLNFSLHNGERLTIPGRVFDSNAFVCQLEFFDYKTHINQVDTIPLNWRKYIWIPLIILGVVALSFSLYALWNLY
ncbi:hypothetical protein [Shewanella sp. OMA3-2]|uniref:hypothetical protein n=1 Tax=Shewanella sp. OMA3-2 TaxID=2908650 RepID=UPI001F2C87AD|nr:hypothetical protein [Shewanella sp. OMA3-2]UJF22657.1 hypothetical protein L0B17_04460 [Shewanella sp. OMA3-2]